jgi:paraquat-inducible protein A
VHRRKRASLARAAALAIAGACMLAPAYALPVLSMEKLGRQHTDTILSGVMKLWNQGMWGIALIVFTASLVVPVIKLTAIGFLLSAVRWPGIASARALTRLHGFVNFIGRWSMLDIFLVAFLAGIVRFGRLATVEARPGAIAFAAVVILTMLATSAFDPRLLWDRNPAPARGAETQ